MASSLVDLVKINVSNTGSGAITLGSAVEGYRGRDVLTNGTVYSYSIQQGSAWEFGRGTYLAESAQIIRSVIDSSDGGTAINLKPNAQIAFTALSADLMPQVQLTADIQAKVDAATAAQTGAETARDQSITAKDTAVAKAAEAAESASAAAASVGAVKQIWPFGTYNVTTAAWYFAPGLPVQTAFDKLRVFLTGTGTADLYIQANDVNILGPIAVTTTPTSNTISVTVPIGRTLSFQLSNITGTPTAILGQMEGLPS